MYIPRLAGKYAERQEQNSAYLHHTTVEGNSECAKVRQSRPRALLGSQLWKLDSSITGGNDMQPIRVCAVAAWLWLINSANAAILAGHAGVVESSATWADRRKSVEPAEYTFDEPNEAGFFGYDNIRDSSGNEHFRFEERFANGTVIGKYGFTDYQNSVMVIVTFIADENGYRPIVKTRRLNNYRKLK